MSGTPRCCNTLRSTPLGNLDPVIRLFEGIFLTASANLIRNREFHVDYLGHAHLFLLSAGPKRRFNDYNFLFWMEWVAVWAFAAAWLTKGRAIFADIAVDLLALPGELLRKHE